ncbi:MAG: hypothetical protein ACREPJ_01100, partial [Rhodanobacteraceae bacterium]
APGARSISRTSGTLEKAVLALVFMWIPLWHNQPSTNDAKRCRMRLSGFRSGAAAAGVVAIGWPRRRKAPSG